MYDDVDLVQEWRTLKGEDMFKWLAKLTRGPDTPSGVGRTGQKLIPSRSSVLLKEATAKKKSGDLERAISLLREAYEEIARSGTIEKPATFLRLPMYLQEAGRPDEAWAEFNAMLAGQYPLDIRQPDFAPLWQSQIYDKMRLFLQREQRNHEAILFGALSFLAYCKWLGYNAATEEFAELREARARELEQQSDPETIEGVIAPLLKTANLQQKAAEFMKVMSRHLKNARAISLSKAHADLRAALS